MMGGGYDDEDVVKMRSGKELLEPVEYQWCW